MPGYASLTLHQYRRLQTRALRSEQAAVFRIREGSKKMGLDGQQTEFTESQLGLIAPRKPLDIENRPGPRGVYTAAAIVLPDGIAGSFSGSEGNPVGRSTARRAGEAFERAASLLQDPSTPAAVKDHAAREVMLWLAEDGIYLKAYINSVKVAAIATLLTLLIGYPIAYGMARAPQEWRATLMMLVILPFWTSFLIRVYAWMGILSNEGFLNQLLMWTGIIGEPLTILNTNTAVYIGIVYTYLPFMILPIYAALERMDGSLIEAAEDLGCSRAQAFWLVTIPLSRPGIAAGSFLVFIPALGEFVIPSLLGGSGTLMIGKVLWEEFFSNRDWPVASAVAVVLLLILVIPIVLFQRNQQKQAEADQ